MRENLRSQRLLAFAPSAPAGVHHNKGTAPSKQSSRAQPQVGPGTRPWKVIAEEVSREHDTKKMAELISELNRAMDAQGGGESANQQNK
jgi:hypothetical protein